MKNRNYASISYIGLLRAYNFHKKYGCTSDAYAASHFYIVHATGLSVLHFCFVYVTRVSWSTHSTNSVQIAAFLRRPESKFGTHFSHELVKPHSHGQVTLERQLATHEGAGRIQLSREHLDEGVFLHDKGHISLPLRWVSLAYGALAILEVDVPLVRLT